MLCLMMVFRYLGLIAALARNNSIFPLRIWVVDNSGSMNEADGYRIVHVKKNNNASLVSCTRQVKSI